MSRPSVHLVAVAVLLHMACSDPNGVTVREDNDPSPPVVASHAAMVRFENHILDHGPTGLDTYHLGFWAVAEQWTRVTIDRSTRDEGTLSDPDDDDEAAIDPFLVFSMPPFSLERRPDGSRIGWGDSVYIEIAVDPRRMFVQFEPTGLTFRRWLPPRLSLWYDDANPDYDRDGDVDADDAMVEDRYLRLWYQETHGEPWYEWEAYHSVEEKRFDAYLQHFSNYAVSW